MSNFQASEIEGTEEKSLTILLEFFKLQKTSWKFQREEKMGEDTVLAFAMSK